MILSAFLQGISKWAGTILSLPPAVWAAITAVVTFVVVAVLFAAIFKVLPDARIGWNHVWVGAVFTAFLFTVGKFILSWYLGREATGSAYGATGALAIVLLWVYYSSLILLFGAEFTQVAANRRGAKILPDDDAVAVGGHDEESVPGEKAVVAGPRELPARVEVAKETAAVDKAPGSKRVLWIAVLPAVSGWMLAPVVTRRMARLGRKSALLRRTSGAVEDFQARHSPPVKLILLSAAWLAWKLKKGSSLE
jgi:hypothetical protein